MGLVEKFTKGSEDVDLGRIGEEVDRDPALKAAIAKRLQLQLRRDELGRRIEEIMSGREEPRHVSLDRAAEAVLAGKPAALLSEDDSWKLETELRAELRVVRRALELAEVAVKRERARVSATICERVAPRYRRALGEVAAALERLATALDESEAISEALAAADLILSDVVVAMPLQAARANVEGTAAWRWMREALERGLIDRVAPTRQGDTFYGRGPTWR